MNSRRRFFRWLPTLPILGPLAVKAGTMTQDMSRVSWNGNIVRMPVKLNWHVNPTVPSLGVPAPSFISVLTDPAGRTLPQLAVWWEKQKTVFPIRITPEGSFMVTVDKGLILVDATMGGLVDLARQTYGLVH